MIVRKSVVDKTGVVVNVIAVSDADQFDPGPDLELSDLAAEIGDTIVDVVVVPADRPERAVQTWPKTEADIRLEELEAALRVLKAKDVLTDAEVDAEKQRAGIASITR